MYTCTDFPDFYGSMHSEGIRFFFMNDCFVVSYQAEKKMLVKSIQRSRTDAIRTKLQP